MGILAVVFDIGGVLEIAPPIGEFTVFADWEARLGLPAGQITASSRAWWDAGRIGSISEDQLHAGLAGSLGWSEIQVAAFMADFWAEYAGTLNAELASYFRGLRPRYRTGIISNSIVGAGEREEELHQFSAMADAIIYSHETGVCKPDRRIYDLTCERLGVRPEQTVFLDDKEECVLGARAAGLHGILFTSNTSAIAEIDALLTSS